ncbi:hypothetical protein ACT3SZ_06265 [Corynebacterium sp. AOP40-9SA-29]|uniref:hypothetical protein n=1 Tax=Corynebacterium sp. AOP40-9SA-29 TaxID=3457677 RepID=UPI0040344CD8
MKGFNVRPLALAVVAGVAISTAACGGQGDAEGEESTNLPQDITVYRPGMLDNDLTQDDVPLWPGPDPDDFLSPHPPSGESGELSGDDAEVVYQAALDNPGSLLEEGQDPSDMMSAVWWVDGGAQWLVVAESAE